jgi:phosphate transport system substrate-binding protein
MLAVYVNRDNPIESLSLPQVDAIFSATRRCGAPADIQRWGDLGLTGDWENRDFTLYSRNAVSGTYGFFKDNALCGGDFKSSINEQPGWIHRNRLSHLGRACGALGGNRRRHRV